MRDRVILWTRAVPEDGGPTARVAWSVAEDAAFTRIVRSGAAVTSAASDYTVKVDADGLEAGRAYHFRFEAAGGSMAAGRTKTLPAADAPEARLAVVSCSNFPAGYFNVYRAIADRDDLDAVLHLGDYIYEYGPGGYATQFGATVGRVPEPPKEIVTLEDYRIRYAQYRGDPDLQAAHGAHPFITIWDDHESANDSWVNGAENHDPNTEGAWEARRAAAIQAYFEWMPIRERGAAGDPLTLNRTFEFGRAASLIMLETRLTARTEPLAYAKDLPLVEGDFDMRDPDNPRLIPPGAAASLPKEAVMRRPVPFDVSELQPRPITDPAKLAAIDPRNPPDGVAFLPDIERFEAMRRDPERELMGDVQRKRVADAIRDSRARGVTWQVLGNQVILASVTSPDLAGALEDDQIAEIERRYPGAGRLVALTRFALPFNLDSWDGYPAARSRLFADAMAADANLIAVTGDTHAFWANELRDDDDNLVGAEFGTSSVTSPSVGAVLNVDDFDIGRAVASRNDDVLFNDVNRRGYLTVTLREDIAIADLIAVSTIYDRTFETEVIKRFAVAPRRGGAPEPVREVSV